MTSIRVLLQIHPLERNPVWLILDEQLMQNDLVFRPTRERLVDRLIDRKIFVDEQIDKLAQWSSKFHKGSQHCADGGPHSTTAHVFAISIGR